MYMHTILGLENVARWSPFKNELLTRLTIIMFSVYYVYLLFISHFGSDCARSLPLILCIYVRLFYIAEFLKQRQVIDIGLVLEIYTVFTKPQ